MVWEGGSDSSDTTLLFCRICQPPVIKLGKKICHHLPGYSSDKDSDSDYDSGSAPHQQIISSSHDELESSRNEIFDSPGFEIVKEDDRIVNATALGPPPWHRPKGSNLVYVNEPADPNNE